MKTRIVKQHSVRRDEILDSVSKLIFTKGYEQMTIQDILNDLNIAKGTVYHYFDSKQALLEALIERIQIETEKPLLPILRNPQLSAIEKLQGFFDALDRLRASRLKDIIRLVRVWYTDQNALFREKVNAAVIQQRAPLINEIVHQGIREGVFTCTYPDKAGEIILYLLQGMGNSHQRLLLALEQAPDERVYIDEIVSTHAVYMEAIERVLGAPPGSLYRIDQAAIQAWVEGFKETGG